MTNEEKIEKIIIILKALLIMIQVTHGDVFQKTFENLTTLLEAMDGEK